MTEKVTPMKRNMRGPKVVPICRCSFCQKPPEESDLLVASKVVGVYVCESCLLSALDTLMAHRPRYVELVRRSVAARGSPRNKRLA